MANKNSKYIPENVIFLSLSLLLIAAGLYFALSAAFPLLERDSQNGVMAEKAKVVEKKLDLGVLDNAKMKQLVIHPREKFDMSKVKAGVKKCPFGGLE